MLKLYKDYIRNLIKSKKILRKSCTNQLLLGKPSNPFCGFYSPYYRLTADDKPFPFSHFLHRASFNTNPDRSEQIWADSCRPLT